MNGKNDNGNVCGQEISAEYAQVLATFPEALRNLVDAEIKDGNAIQSIDYGFPAAPCGASVKLARQAKTERRVSTTGVDFYERNNPQYCGEFTTHQRHFFVLEPPMPPEPAPDMDAIREQMAARQREADAPRFQIEIPSPLRYVTRSEVVDRFRESLEIDYESWREGVGYDLSCLQTATEEERAEIERILLSRNVDDWRDVEALAALDSPKAFEKLRNAFKRKDYGVVMAILEHAPQLVTVEERTEILVAALESADFYHGLSQAFHHVEQFHPPVIIETLLNCLLERESGVLVQFAGMLMYLHGKANEPFDWEQRPFFLRFNTPDRRERESAFRDLCDVIGIDPEKYLKARQ